jgi:predicted ATP-dependent serine protease
MVGRGAAVKPTDGEPDIEEMRKLFWTPKDVYERAGEKDTPVVPGFLYEGFMVDLAGEAGSGKTTLLMAMVKAILTGGRFLGRECQKGPVIYLTEQAENICTAMGHVGLNPEHEGLYLLPKKNVDDRTWEETYTVARRMAKDVGAKAIFTDTIDDFGGLESDQNSNDGDVRKMLSLPKAAAQVDGLAVVNVRQMNKQGKGSVEFDHSPDIVMALHNLPNGPENAGEIRGIKWRTREEGDRAIFTINTEAGERI